MLNLAAQVGSYDMIKFLLDKGCDINTTNNYGNTPLHYTIGFEYVLCTDFLIRMGAKEKIKNFRGHKAWEGP